jgi:hypothetical protein
VAGGPTQPVRRGQRADEGIGVCFSVLCGRGAGGAARVSNRATRCERTELGGERGVVCRRGVADGRGRLGAEALDGVGLSDEADHAHGAGASGPDQRIDFVDTAEQICPSLARGRGVRRRCSLGTSGLGLVLGHLMAPSVAPGGARIEAMVADQVLSWRRDLCQDAGHILHGGGTLHSERGRSPAPRSRSRGSGRPLSPSSPARSRSAARNPHPRPA